MALNQGLEFQGRYSVILGTRVVLNRALGHGVAATLIGGNIV